MLNPERGATLLQELLDRRTRGGGSDGGGSDGNRTGYPSWSVAGSGSRDDK